MAAHFHKLSIRDVRNETADCISIGFYLPEELKEAFAFIQGQNITIKVLVDNQEIRRSYSICSSPLENELRIAVKKIANGKFSSYADTLRKNALLEILPPTGKFYTELNPSNKKNYIAFVAGSGITPVISIIKTTLATEPGSSFTLIYGNQHRNSIIFKEELEAIKNRYIDRFVLHNILSREKTDAEINHGRITAAKCEEFAKIINMRMADDFFICGPEQMIFTVKDWLERKGIEKKKIHFELFTVPGQEQAGDSRPLAANEKMVPGKISHITIKQDGISFNFDLPFDDETILNAALKQGVDLPFACKGGVCSTCRAKLIEGEVEMEHNYALEPDELEKGFILTCQSHPRADRITVDFDIK
ncbi:MAG TPA: 1,2-phenylacetyl-CoA epoxidase subunit PaaE [Puia sp.]|nr:1,2-phenylacetyl-CoA epoxidase subunit PaaE [Puia sp.]